MRNKEIFGVGLTKDYELSFPNGPYEKGYIDGCKLTDLDCVMKNKNTIWQPLEFNYPLDNLGDSNVKKTRNIYRFGF